MRTLLLSVPVFLFCETHIYATTFRSVPDEFESTGDHSLGMSNAGMVATGGLAAVKLNPAMLPLEHEYRVSAGYHWPSAGREFYQAGVVDSTSSSVAAGVLYTSAQDDYLKVNLPAGDVPDTPEEREKLLDANSDTPAKRRVSLAIGKAFEQFSLGMGGQIIEAWDENNPADEMVKGNTLGMGIAGMLFSTLRVGASAENLANTKVKDYAPRTYRAGAALMMFSGNVTVHLDYRDRERVAAEIPKLSVANPLADQPEQVAVESEKMAFFSASARVQDVIRLLGAFGQSIGDDHRQNASGGIAVVSNKVVLSYLVSRPYLTSPRLHQAVNMGLDVAL